MRPPRAAALVLLALLPGCILQSGAPLVDKGVLVLGAGEVRLNLFQPDPAHPGAWTPADPPQLTIKGEGGHYTVPDPSEPANAAKAVRMWLVPLDAGHVGVQVTDATGLLYGLADWNGRDFDLAMLDCDSMRGQPQAAGLVVFEGDDCHPAGTPPDPDAWLKALIPLMPQPSLRATLAP